MAAEIKVGRSPGLRTTLAVLGVVFLGGFLVIHIWKDLTATVDAWYFHSTWVWLVVMAIASAIFFREMSALRKEGVDVEAVFAELPPE